MDDSSLDTLVIGFFILLVFIGVIEIKDRLFENNQSRLRNGTFTE